MTVELFDEDEGDPVTKMIVAIYPMVAGFVHHWWLDIPGGRDYDVGELLALREAMSEAQGSLDKLLDLLVRQKRDENAE